ncbi:hypothetical protein GF412_01520 [Candidatus Micrarchaeota archaeon]|nr:hypothetical protein [Candidatus Micrarchaeota archaeon]MBD3417647.1 hypothetical protein [Candidatus Micrarchaeota archaeon]
MSRIIAFSLVLGLLLFSGCVVEQFMDPGAIAVWQQKDDGDWEIRYSLWNDNTKAWYTPAGPATDLIASVQGDDHDPYIDSDGEDTAVSVWSHESGGSADIYYSVWNSNAWTAPQPVATPEGYDSDPAVAMGQDGTAVSAWVHKGPDGTTMLYYSAYDGSSWSSPAPVSREHTKVSLPELSYASTIGVYFLTWTESTDAGTRVFASGYSSGTWAPPVEIPGQTKNAVFDINVPTDQRMGLGTANKKREAIAVWPTTNGELYSSTWTPSGWSNAVLYGAEEMPDAEYEYGGVPYSVFINGRELHWSIDLYSTGGVNPVPGTGEDYRPAITFIGDRVTGLALFWTTKTLPSEIYYVRWDGAAWEPVRPIDAATVPGEDRNPDISPLMKVQQEWDYYFDWCGDGVIQWPNIWGQFEECEVGVPCPNPNDWCNDQCLCIPDYGNNTWCGDGIVQKPNSAGVMEECEAGVPCPNPNELCNVNTCKCTPEEDVPPEEPPDDEYPPGTQPEDEGEDGEDEEPEDEQGAVCGNGNVEAGEECDIGGGLIDGVRHGAAKDTCQLSYSCGSDCKCYPGIVTPRCGDGYISGPEQGANEECDTGGRMGAPELPDTCTPPEVCNAICRCEEPSQEDGMHYECVEGGCMLVEGEGENECLYDYNCRHYECQDEHCVEVLTPGENECLTDQTCQSTHTECEDGVCVEVYGEGEDECSYDDDCMQYHYECVEGDCVQVEGEGSNECQSDSDCEPEEYCGDGIVQEGRGEECESDNDCDGGVCDDCICYYPPELDCGHICSQTSGAEFIAAGLPSESECGSVVQDTYMPEDCMTTCRYSWFYRVDNVAGYASCCCGMVKRFECTDCPGQNPQCPGKETCEENEPSWYDPQD